MSKKIYLENTHKDSLRDHFLIALPGLRDSIFSSSITYVCDHNEHGAMGIVLTHPLNIYLNDVFDQLAIKYDPSAYSVPVLAGGPVNVQQGFVLHRDQGEWDSTLQIADDVCLTASRDIVNAIAENRGPAGAQFALGYAGWSSGQLEEEIAANSWLTIPAEKAIIFDVPISERRAAVEKHLGVNLNLISRVAGHA